MGYEMFRRMAGVTALWTGGAITANQISKIPAVSENLQSLEERLSEFSSAPVVDSLELSIAVLSAWAIVNAYKKRQRESQRKKSEAQGTIQPQKQSRFKRSVYSAGRAIGVGGAAAAVSGLALGSFDAMHDLYHGAANLFSHAMHSGADSVSSTYHTLFEHQYIGSTLKALVGITTSNIGTSLYKTGVLRKHGPVLKRVTIDGYMPITRWLLPRNMLTRRALPWQSAKYAGFHSMFEVIARVSIKDYRTGEYTSTGTIGHRLDLEPRKKSVPDISRKDLEYVIANLEEASRTPMQESDSPQTPSHPALDVIPGTMVRDLYSKSKLRDNRQVNQTNVRRMLSYLEMQTNILDIDKDRAREILNDRNLYERGSHFSRVFCEDEDESPVQFASLEENVPQTISNTSDPKSGYGPDFRRKGRVLPFLQFRHGRGKDVDMTTSVDTMADSHDGQDVDHHDDLGHDQVHPTQIDMNYITFWRKGWNQYLWRGLGRVANIYFHNTLYIYDEQWLRSFGGIRRVSFITDTKGTIVAKMYETQCYLKPFGNYNRIVDIFDEKLAEDNSFARIMAMFGDFETHHRLYEKHRLSQLQESGPKAHETNTTM